jgi:guanosine-3',5'-bis(diphosphate) 3'-pyrophosphohydrolase
VNATALDFAYTIHTDVGNHTRSVLVDHVEVPLSTRLENGQTVEVITDPKANPAPDWLSFVVTARARTAIRHYIRSLEQADTVQMGNRMLETALNARGSSLDEVPPERIDEYLSDNHFKRLENLLESLALGGLLANLVAAKLAPDAKKGSDQAIEALTIAGSEGNVVDFGACCHPVPGDRIMGYVSAGKGIVVHRVICRNVREFRKHPDRCIDVTWAPIIKTYFQAGMRILVRNSPGVLANISSNLSEAGSNIEKVEQSETNPETASLLFTITVRDRDHMARVMRRLRRNRNVIRVSRISA